MLKKKWLDHVARVVSNQDNATNTDGLSWSAYHASIETNRQIFETISCLLPLFQDSSKTVSMIKHSMEIVKNADNFLNPSQIPVITMDQPLYTIAKYIQWTWPELGEDKYVVVMGGLHIENGYIKGSWKLARGLWVDFCIN